MTMILAMRKNKKMRIWMSCEKERREWLNMMYVIENNENINIWEEISLFDRDFKHRVMEVYEKETVYIPQKWEEKRFYIKPKIVL